MTHNEQFLSAMAILMRNDPINLTRVNAMRLMTIAGITDGTTYRALRASNVDTVKLSRTTVRILIEAGRASLVDNSVTSLEDLNFEHQDTRKSVL